MIQAGRGRGRGGGDDGGGGDDSYWVVVVVVVMVVTWCRSSYRGDRHLVSGKTRVDTVDRPERFFPIQRDRQCPR